ncbi:hypothetical protein [uncultured Cocleimonas sp.]|uniref:hypothetical protein n=1 Tax=uncultured Cocleimonas sp. TaxID=1051587 RepID=UPI0026284D88|nr:hypothetical protein [uncultured Cocleimonas sp.]
MKLSINKCLSYNLFKISSILLFSSLFATGCSSVITKKSPPISHVHVGHTLTSWIATPGKKGLLTTAEQESQIVVNNASKAKISTSLAQKKKYMSNALHAVDPKIQSTGSGKGYGLVRAVTESIAHLQYAATSDDASVNLRKTVPTIVNKARQIASSSNQLKVFGQAAVNASSINEFTALNNEFLKTAKQINGDGSSSTYNLKQFKKEILAMVSKEKPAYTTVDSYYLLNLIRLPNGKWAFSSKPKDDDSTDGGY